MLKSKLVTEWDAITRENKLVRLPKEGHTVASILDEFEDAMDKREPWVEIVEGLKSYFDKTLKQMLLYPQEETQAEKVLRGSKRPRDVYGAEHLLRLFVKLPDILPFTNLDEESLETLVARLGAIVRYIADRSGELFSDEEDKSS